MPRYLQCSTIGISNSLRKNEGCLILIALLLKHKVNDLEPLYNNNNNNNLLLHQLQPEADVIQYM